MSSTKRGPGRPKGDRTKALYAWVKPINHKFIHKKSKQAGIPFSPYMDLILDQMRATYGPEEKAVE